MRRLPNKRTDSASTTFAKIPIPPIMVVVKLGSSNIPNALKIGTIYGRIANIAVNINWNEKFHAFFAIFIRNFRYIPVNCMNANANVVKRNGLIDRFRVISLNLSRRVGAGCVHFVLDFMQSPHADDIALMR